MIQPLQRQQHYYRSLSSSPPSSSSSSSSLSGSLSPPPPPPPALVPEQLLSPEPSPLPLSLELQLQQQQQQQQPSSLSLSLSSSSPPPPPSPLSSLVRNNSLPELNLHTLPSLPTKLNLAQCISFKDELLICGGYFNNECYSYHVLKQQYKFICSYPAHVQLEGHTVVPYFPITTSTTSSSSSSSFEQDSEQGHRNGHEHEHGHEQEPDSITLISFGGAPYRSYHTLRMKYQSVWNESSSSSSSSSSLHINEWLPLPNQMVFGEIYGHDLRGARALIGRRESSQPNKCSCTTLSSSSCVCRSRDLLFITHYPNYIDVIDLHTFQYISHNALPLSEVHYHIFVAWKATAYEFILCCEGETILLKYDENNRKFSYHNLPSCSLLRNCWQYSYFCWNDAIYIFGGSDFNCTKYMDLITIFDIKKKKWQQRNLKLPHPICESFAVVNERDSSMHVIGGINDIATVKSTHFVSNIKDLEEWTEEEIKMILENWIRAVGMHRIGWIKEFNMIILSCINLSQRKRKRSLHS